MLRRIQRLVVAVARAVAQGWRLSALAPSPGARARVMAAVVWLALPLGGYGDVLVEDAADLAAVEEVLLGAEYDLPGLDDVEVIVDLGSHIGTSILYFRARYPETRIYGFEPDPETFAKLERNVGGLERVTVQRRAVTGTGGESKLYASPYSLRSSLVGGWADARAVSVPAATLDRIVGELGLDRIDLLKLDIEGSEYDALAGADALGRVRAIAGELHPRLTDPDAFLALLGDFDVRVDRASDVSWHFQAVRRG